MHIPTSDLLFKTNLMLTMKERDRRGESWREVGQRKALINRFMEIELNNER